ncbi:MAG: DegT/DnrJ/EryC1/StrS family aminotransferase [Candidatus Solibacter usitatus]|nr:DegT/DnrJ/EryC1/StrS family aminotransferase [Candidatus Solibacter usitatus]
MRIPVIDLSTGIAEVRAAWEGRLERILADPHLILGPEGAAFEGEFARATGAAQVVACGNGTAAIELCLRESGVTRGSDEVWTTPLTAPFTGIGIISPGASIRFADIDPVTLLLDPDDAGNRATRRIKALVAVHLYGHVCEMGRLRTLARSRGAVLIQDAAQAHGASFQARPLTAFGRFVTYSFYPTKNLGCLGDGGAIALGSGTVAARLSSLRDGGRGPRTADMISRLKGINSRLDEVQAAYLRAALPRLGEWNARRGAIAEGYDQRLAGCPGVTLLPRPPGSVNHLYVVRAKRRERLREFLAARGIGTGVHYPVPLHLHPAFRLCGLKRGDLPHAERAAREVLSLPMWPQMAPALVDEVAEAICRFYC